MRVFVKLGVSLAIVVAAGAAFAPPLFAHGQLDGYARDAAQKGAAVLLNQGPAAAEALATEAASQHSGVHIDGVTVNGQSVFVTLSETVKTYVHDYRVTATEGSTLGE